MSQILKKPNLLTQRGIRLQTLHEPEEEEEINKGYIKEWTGADIWVPDYNYIVLDDMKSCPVSLPYDECYPSCRYCWNGYIFAHGKVFCDKCNISRQPTFQEEVTRNHMNGIISTCKNGHLIELNTENRRFECKR